MFFIVYTTRGFQLLCIVVFAKKFLVLFHPENNCQTELFFIFSFRDHYFDHSYVEVIYLFYTSVIFFLDCPSLQKTYYFTISVNYCILCGILIKSTDEKVFALCANLTVYRRVKAKN